jgi:hypothetical protein
VPENDDSDYIKPAFCVFPTTTVVPAQCEARAVYSCQFVSGPTTDVSLDGCSVDFTNGNYHTTVVFSTEDGSLTFETDDFLTFPVGVYTFSITITIGTVTETVTNTVTLHPGCENADLTIVGQPAMTFYHTLGTPMQEIFTYNINSLVHSTSSTNCGVPVIEFMNADGTAYSSTIFLEDRSTSDYSLAINYLDDLELLGEYSLVFKFYYSQQPSNRVTSSAFTVHIINPCVPPVGCIDIDGCGILPPVLAGPEIEIHIEYTITQSVLVYEIPAWDCGSPFCAGQITYSTPDVLCCAGCLCCEGPECDSTGTAIVIVDTSITIQIESCEDICGTDPAGTTYVFVVEGCLGDNCTPVECEIVIYNPCLDPDYFTVDPVTLPQIEYTLLQSGSYNHNDFTVLATSEVMSVCGGLTYEISAGELDIYISYNAELHVIEINCNNFDLVEVGTIEYTINVYLTAYPGCACTACCGSSTGTIVIVNPCLSATLSHGEI